MWLMLFFWAAVESLLRVCRVRVSLHAAEKHVETNLVFGWVWIVVGLASGAWLGMFFYDADWLGGYGTWRRRMVRLGHISFVGTGLLNVAAAVSVAARSAPTLSASSSWLLILGAATMPAICLLSAWRDGFRHWFAIPVASLILGTAAVALQVAR